MAEILSVVTDSPFMLSATTCLGLILVLWGLSLNRPSTSERRLSVVMVNMARVPENEAGIRTPVYRRLVGPIVTRLGRLLSKAYPTAGYMEIEHGLAIAGRPLGWSAHEYIGARALCSLFGAGLGFLLGEQILRGMGAVTFAMILGSLGFILPAFWLKASGANRQKAIERDLPDILDMLSLCMEAGLSLEGAVAATGKRWRGPLMEEFGQALAEIHLGWSRHDAFKRMTLRTNVEQLESFVTAMIQSDQLGTSLRRVLKNQAVDARIAHRHRVEEAGHKAPLKMVFPMTMFILPAIFIVVIGPSLPAVKHIFGG